jgi:RNA polymerase sigma factor (sigma-70 family)
MGKYRVEIKIKNNLLYKLIMQDSDSVAEFCRKHNLCQQTIGRLLNFKYKIKDYKSNRTVKKLCLIFKVLPEDIFCDEFLEIERNTISLESNIRYVEHATRELVYESEENIRDNNELKNAIKNILTTIPKRERKIIEMRYGLVDGYSHTLEEVGHVFKCSRERIAQLERKGLRRLRHPARSDMLQSFINT